MTNVLNKILQASAIALVVLAVSLAWRTGIQKAAVCPDSLRDELHRKACARADGCIGLFSADLHFDESINAWVPNVRVIYAKDGRYNAPVIQAKVKQAMEEEATNGFFLLRNARKKMQISFVKEK